MALTLHGFGPALLEGASVTLGVAGLSAALALALGTGAAAAGLSRRRGLRALALAYAGVVRGVPDLLLMLLVFYGGQMLVNRVADAWQVPPPDVDPWVAGVLSIGVVCGAYVGEVLRGAWLAVPPGPREAAAALGFTPVRTLWRITGPLAVRHALPGLSNQWLVLLKSTSLVSVIGLSDLMGRAGQAAGATREPFLFWLAAGVLYLVLTALSEAGFAWCRRRWALDDGTGPAAVGGA